MENKFVIKFAWECEHECFGDIISFLVSPRVRLGSGPCVSLVYNLDDANDEVIRFPAGHPQALSITKRLAQLNPTQWATPSFETIEEEFDLDDFFTESHYQDNYGREVLFYTNNECLF